MAGIDEFLAKRKKAGCLRSLNPVSWRKGARIRINSKEYIDFSSNDYLGLSSHPKLIKAGKKAINEFGTGACASRLLSGDLELHHFLEERVAKFKHKEAGLVFNSGYQANVGIISALCSKAGCIFSDRLNHASIVDGILLSGARFFRFQHNDIGHLELLLKRERRKFREALVITESIFSMDGDESPLKDIVKLKEKYDFRFMVDEAHATGIFGSDGSGMVREKGVSEKVDLIMGTFSKALGSFGAYLACSRKIADYLINSCRSFIYSTALPAAVIAGNLMSIQLIQQEPWRRKKLLDLACFFRKKLEKKGFRLHGSSQIVPVVIGDNAKTVKFAQILQEKGFWALAIRPPTVPQGEARLRFSLTVNHEKEILSLLINELTNIKV
ncbi:MAG: 8-amino-7-oxononanoate synthase [Candidatus Omnitrophota bacterium]|nr:8-amino-7-oxononanoate synthase [Candidatus Omnitrophota bacterium]